MSEGSGSDSATAEPGGAVSARLAELVDEMRTRGAAVGVGQLLAAQRALAAVDPGSRNESRLALRASLCGGRADVAAFDEAWLAWVATAPERQRAPIDPVATAVLPRVAVPDRTAAALELELDAETEVKPAAWSDVELLTEKDFAEYSDAERALARSLIAAIARRGPQRRSRRSRASRRRSHHPDPRATMRAAMRYAGEPLERRWREPRSRPRPLVLVCDVSGSMAPYSRMLLQYAQACVAARRRCETFAFGTRLTRITAELRGRDPDLALERAAQVLADSSGGTRIGESLAALNREHGRRIGRGALVVVVSDGWDRGDPDELAAELARLGRCAHRLVWLNPLKASPGFEPLTRGMVAALPHVDDFLAGNSLASLAELAALMESDFTRGGSRSAAAATIHEGRRTR